MVLSFVNTYTYDLKVLRCFVRLETHLRTMLPFTFVSDIVVLSLALSHSSKG